jgi:hypothetical protein
MISLELFDPRSWAGELFLQVVGGLLFAAVIAALGWLFGPIRWWWRNRMLRKLIFGRREFILVYNPHTGASKTVVFLYSGQIGAGRNDNEDSWRVRRGCLEFLADDGRVYSRFKLNRAAGRLASTTDSDIQSARTRGCHWVASLGWRTHISEYSWPKGPLATTNGVGNSSDLLSSGTVVQAKSGASVC